jgi:hypothetical protein
LKRIAIIFSILLLVSAGLYIFQKEREERYKGQTIIPEQSKDVPLYKGLRPDGTPEYVIQGDHWEEILAFYKKSLPDNGWHEVFIQVSDLEAGDGSGFMSTWAKKGQPWDLYISAGHFKNMNQTEVIFDKRKKMTSTAWIENQPVSICINEQPERSKNCYEMTDDETITKIIRMVNEAFDWDKDIYLYEGRSRIEFGALQVEVYYDLEKGIYLVSDKGTKWMKPEREFFETTRISKEY